MRKSREPKQLEFKKTGGWGGKRRGAGRPNRSGTPNHMARQKVDFKKPLHVTLKLKEGIHITLRTSDMLVAFQQSAEKARKHQLHVIHFSLESNHLHLIVECANNKALADGMKSLAGSFGRAIRKCCGGRGAVFKGRFHLQVFKSPTQMKNGLAYVLLNQSKHEKLIPYNDRYSSAEYFGEWKKLLGREIGPLLPHKPKFRKLPAYLSTPQSWLAREGWRLGRV